MCITMHGSRNVKFHTVCYHAYYECARNRLMRSLRSKNENVLCAGDCPSVQCALYHILNRQIFIEFSVLSLYKVIEQAKVSRKSAQ
jgi:hypothetical protein